MLLHIVMLDRFPEGNISMKWVYLDSTVVGIESLNFSTF